MIKVIAYTYQVTGVDQSPRQLLQIYYGCCVHMKGKSLTYCSCKGGHYTV